MGMYDNINFQMDCPHCRKKMDDFQSQDGPCALFLLDFWQVNNFYDSCNNCRTWVEFTIKDRKNREITIEDFDKKVKLPTLEGVTK